jgi:hypothetical protein
MHLLMLRLLQWGEQDNYEVVRKVGRGKYSEVFEVSSASGQTTAAATPWSDAAPGLLVRRTAVAPQHD